MQSFLNFRKLLHILSLINGKVLSRRIHIDGNYKAFAQKLVQKGFKQIDITGRIVIYLMYFDSHSYVVCSYADDVNVQALRQTILDDI